MSSRSTQAHADESGPASTAAVQPPRPAEQTPSPEVLLEFQQTMRQFLKMQERILVQFLQPVATDEARAAPATTSPAPSSVLIRATPNVGADGGVVLHQPLTLASDPYLADHVIDGRAVLPMAMALEYIAQFAARCWPQRHVSEVRQLQLMSGVTVDAERPPRLELRASAPSVDEGGVLTSTIELWTAVERPRLHYRASVRLTDARIAAPPSRLSVPSGAPMAGMQAYTTLLFHGPRFRCIEQIPALGESGALAMLRTSTPAQLMGADTHADARWLFDPAALDAAPQLAWIWGFTHRNAAALPTLMPSVRRYGPATGAERLQLIQSISAAAGSTTLRYEAEYLDDSGRVRYAISAGESTLSPALNRLVPASPAFARRAPDDRLS